MDKISKTTLVMGASEKPWRYSNMALNLLASKGVSALAIGMKAGKVGDVSIQTGQPDLVDVHTITMYVSREHQPPLYEYILKLAPARIIFNPGTENPELAALAEKAGIETIEACTLVMLRTGQF